MNISNPECEDFEVVLCQRLNNSNTLLNGTPNDKVFLLNHRQKVRVCAASSSFIDLSSDPRILCASNLTAPVQMHSLTRRSISANNAL